MQTMSSMIKPLFFLLAVMLLASCSKGTDPGKVFVPQQGHPDQWASYLAVGTTDFHGTYITSVPSDQSAGNGAALFVRHCAPCHNSTATGKIGPNILAILQFSTDIPANITGTIKAVPLMQGQVVLSPAEIQDISGYLSTLINGATAVPAVRQTELCIQCHGVDLGGGISQVSCFSCHNGPDGAVGHPAGWVSGKDNPVSFHGAYGQVFEIGCTTCHGVDLNGGPVLNSPTGLAPACSKCHNGTIVPVLLRRI
jgi:mono/diheme cytochrome c family protein